MYNTYININNQINPPFLLEIIYRDYISYILMEFPEEIQRLINEYAKPLTRPDWRDGCYLCRITANTITDCKLKRKYLYNKNICIMGNVIKYRLLE